MAELQLIIVAKQATWFEKAMFTRRRVIVGATEMWVLIMLAEQLPANVEASNTWDRRSGTKKAGKRQPSFPPAMRPA